MEQITKRGNDYYYGEVLCHSVDDAYYRFREDYHASLGRDSSRRLGRIGKRAERIHGFGFVYEGGTPAEYDTGGVEKVPYRILGLIGIHYSRILGCWDYSYVRDEDFEVWFDWVFRKGTRQLKKIGVKDKSGRTRKGRKIYR